MNDGTEKQISLGEGFGDVAVKVNGATVQIHADGSIAAYSAHDIDAYTNASVRLHPAANDAVTPFKAEPQPGDRMADGTVFAGTSPDTGKPMYTTPADAPLTMKWKDAMKYATKLDVHGHHDWRVPTKSELNVLFNNRAAIGGFNVTGSTPAGWYWSSTEYDLSTWGQRFSDGHQSWHGKGNDSSLRCVR